MSKKEAKALAKSFRNNSIAFIGSKTTADLQSIVKQSIDSKVEIGFVGIIGKGKEIRLKALPIDESNKVNQVDVGGQVENNYSSSEQNSLFLEGHTHIQAYVEGWTYGDGSDMAQQKGMGSPTKPEDYTLILDRGSQPGVKGAAPSLIATPYGITVYGSGQMTPVGQPNPNNSYLIYKNLK